MKDKCECKAYGAKDRETLNKNVKVQIYVEGELKETIECQNFVGVALRDAGDSIDSCNVIVGAFDTRTADIIVSKALPRIQKDLINQIISGTLEVAQNDPWPLIAALLRL